MSCIGGYIQEETEFAETLSVSVCVCVRLRLWHARRDFVARDSLEDGLFVSLSVTSRDVYDSCCEGTYIIFRYVH